MVSVIRKNSNKNQYGSNYFTKSSRHKYVGNNLRSIFEDRFLFEEGVYWVYTTDEERNIDRKDEQNILTI